MSNKEKDNLSKLVTGGCFLKECQRVNVEDENDIDNNQHKKLVLINNFIDEKSESVYQIERKDYVFKLPNDHIDSEIENLLNLNEEQKENSVHANLFA
ncbi:unnamed protein product [Rotaria sordida]|uniref:Uncharacterized protein n=1 Tax=Rotaria sordida TaxID=392033 RepID=A0A814EK86_9BILA|nr:unnamed protein product [Rotaria sordida]CAF3923415.1 unnamed protein product [Rotaria sordida]